MMTRMDKEAKTPHRRKCSARCRFVFKIGLLVLFLAALIAAVILFVPFGTYDFSAAPGTAMSAEGIFQYNLPLDPKSPWAKFRANELQNGRVPVKPTVSGLTPWSFQTGKGIFSSPVVDGEGNIFIGSADTYFYSLNSQGKLRWSLKTGEIIDSSALLDDAGFVYFGSGDAYVYKVERDTGKVVWKSAAHTVEEVQKEFGIKTYNVNWFEGNVGILPDGTLLAPNDNYLVYSLDRQNGEKRTIFKANEMVWSLPSVNIKTGRLFFASCSQILQNVFSYSLEGVRQWLTGSFGTVAATTMLTNNSEKGAVIVGGFDGYVRAFAQDSGKLLWKFGTKDHIYASPAQLSNGTIIQPSTDGTLYAINPQTGKAIWEFDTLEPIRSSPAVDGEDNIYFGNGEGKLYCIKANGTLRWSYQLITDLRNDLNGSPALGKDGVVIAGESGEVFFVPYDYPLSEKGKQDPRSFWADEAMPADGAHLIYTTSFGALLLEPKETINANEPITLSLLVRENGNNLLTALERNSVKVSIEGNEQFRVEVGATNKFINIVPFDTWKPDDEGKITLRVSAVYKTGLQRFGLKFFGGRNAGTIDQTFRFSINKPSAFPSPFLNAVEDGQQSRVEFSRLSVPTPSMLPSYNQIGFDSLHYIGGAVAKNQKGEAILWVIEGRLDENGETSIDPEAITRYPLLVHYENGLVTLINDKGFKIKFIGSWDMPFASYRISSAVDSNGKLDGQATVVAVANSDEIEFYGIGLKLVGMSDFKTGQMFVRGGTKLSAWQNASMPSGVGKVSVAQDAAKITAKFSGSALKANEHVYSIMAVDEKGDPLPFYYTKNTAVIANEDGSIQAVSLVLDKNENASLIKSVYVLVDTYPVFVH